jgi:lysophospholipase L1-like esterase
MKKVALSLLGLLLLVLAIYRINGPFQNDSPNFFRGDDDRLRYVGRFDLSEGHAPKSWAPGAYMECEVYGKSAEIILKDEHRFGSLHNYIEVIVDHKYQRRIKLSRKINVISLFKFSKPGKHHILICKNTESAIGFIQYLGIKCEKLLPPKNKKKRLFEFIGDSITCGNGSDSTQLSFGKGSWYDYHNAYLSYGPLLARQFDADWILSSVSGIGMQHSCCGMTYTMPEVYFNIDFQRRTKNWSFKGQSQPDWLFITLGQNDNVNQMEKYESAYLSFIRKVRKVYPKSWIICCTSPMAKEDFKVKQTKSISNVLNAQRKAGDQRIVLFSYRKTYTAGYDKHPTIPQHQQMCDELVAFIQANNCFSK